MEIRWRLSFFFPAEDGIRDAQKSRGLEIYIRNSSRLAQGQLFGLTQQVLVEVPPMICCTRLLYTSDAADDPLCVDLGGRAIINNDIVSC